MRSPSSRPPPASSSFETRPTSFVPAVRGIFERRFGSAKLESGAELVSIATGLALLGAEEDLDDWSERAG